MVAGGDGADAFVSVVATSQRRRQQQRRGRRRLRTGTCPVLLARQPADPRGVPRGCFCCAGLRQVADGPARRAASFTSCGTPRLAVSAINWPSSSVDRTSTVASIVNFDGRRSLVYRTRRPPLSNYVDDTLRRSTGRGEIFQVQSSGQFSTAKCPYFWRYQNFPTTLCRIGQRKISCPKPAGCVLPF